MGNAGKTKSQRRHKRKRISSEMKLKARRTKKRRNRKVRQTNRRNMFKRSRRIAHSREIRLAVKESFIKLIKLITRNRKEDAL